MTGAYSGSEVVEDLELLDLVSVSLRKLGITRKALIYTEKDLYPMTRKWAEKLISNARRRRGWHGYQGRMTLRAR